MRFTKKLVAVALVLIMAVTLMPSIVFANDAIRVAIDGQEVVFPEGQNPITVGGHTLVPIRGVFEALGFEVEWDRSTRTATLTRTGYVVIITLDSNVFTTNGITHTLEVPAQLIGGSTMLPIRAVLESVGYELDWDRATRTVAIVTSTDTSTNAVPNTRIGQILGIPYTISLREYIYGMGTGHLRWQWLYLYGDLNINYFSPSRDSPEDHWYHSIFEAERGDVFIIRWWDAETYSLLIGLGNGAYHWRYIGTLSSNPHEIIDVGRQREQVQIEERLARFNMSRQYTSDNFYFYARDERSEWLPEMAQVLEDAIPMLEDIFGVSLSQRVSVRYYDHADYVSYYLNWEADEYGGYGGHAGSHAIAVTRPRMQQELSTYMVGLLIHELVHIFQHYIADWVEMYRLNLGILGWVGEGTATYLDGDLDRRLYRIDLIREMIQTNSIPTLSYLEYTIHINRTIEYTLAATIMKFIHQTWGMDYVVAMNRVHGDFQGIFGITHAEFESQWHEWLRDTFS